ncbi:MAG: hypothetical protein GX902_02945 [Lentisphaerae bacterium]|nr:hypothetical protein [Lentisphaerota bacterium]
MRPLIRLWLLLITGLWLGMTAFAENQDLAMPAPAEKPEKAEKAGKVKKGKKAERVRKAEKAEKAEVEMPAPAALELTAEEKEDLELFKKFSRPEKRPKVTDQQLETQEKRLSDLISLYHELGEKMRERKTLSDETDEKIQRKNQRKISKLDREIKKLKKDLVKEAEQLRRPLDRRYDEYMKEKEAYDKKVAEAEKNNDERRIEKLSQEFARKGNRIDGLKNQIDCINYYLFWDEFTGKKAEEE